MKKMLSVDYGESWIGLAISDSENKIALPYKIITNDNFVKQLKDICEQEDIGKIVVGLPLALSGEETEQTKEVKNVVETLKREFTIPIEVEDERMTSKLASAVVKGKKEDASAAAIILQSYLDRRG